MAVQRIAQGLYREVWRDTDVGALPGGAPPTVIQTDIGYPYAVEPDELNQYVNVLVFIDAVAGVPVVPEPVASLVGGKVAVSIQNNQPGTSAAYTVEVELKHSEVR